MAEQTNVQTKPEENGTNQSLFGEEVAPEDRGNPTENSSQPLSFFEDVDFDDASLGGDDENKSQENEPEPAAEEPAPWVDPTKPNLNPEEAAIHWKDRHTNSQEYITKLQGELNQYQGMSPEYIRQLQSVETMLRDNPDIIDSLYNRAAGKQTQPVEPQPIQVPDYYDPSEALDPTTPSGKWKMQQEQAQQQNLLSQMQNIVSDALSKRDQADAARAAEQARQAEIQNLYTKYNLDQAEAAGFQSFLQNGPGRDLTMEDKYNFYLMLNGRMSQAPAQEGEPQPDLDSKINEIQNTVRKPGPQNTPAGGHLQDLNPQEVFNRGLLKTSGPRWKVG